MQCAQVVWINPAALNIWVKLLDNAPPVLWPIKSVQRNSSPKAQWTERYIYYLGKFCPGTFFFKRPYLGNETRFCKCVGAKILVLSRAFTHSFMKVTSPHSFILFRPLSRKRALFRGVPGGPFWAILVQNMPLGLFSLEKKNRIAAGHIKRLPR